MKLQELDGDEEIDSRRLKVEAATVCHRGTESTEIGEFHELGTPHPGVFVEEFVFD